MKVTIHQPEHMPWLGFFHKINMVDVYVVLDNVQYRRRYFQNRNKIRTKDGWQWLIVPLEKEERDELLIKNAKISKADMRWREDNVESMRQNYYRTAYFENYWDEFKAIYNRDYCYLSEFNIGLIKFFLQKLGLKKDIVLASELGVSGDKGDLIFDICKVASAKTYISGISGKDYLNFDKFNANHIEVVIQEFHHPIYKQFYQPFMPCMSVIDLLFNYGGNSLEIINGVGVEVIKKIMV